MKIGRFIITLLIGGLIGGCIALLINYNHSFHFFGNYHYATHSNVILISLICVALILVLSMYLIMIQKKPFITNVYQKHILMKMKQIHMIRKLI